LNSAKSTAKPIVRLRERRLILSCHESINNSSERNGLATEMVSAKCAGSKLIHHSSVWQSLGSIGVYVCYATGACGP